jgi:hypothetical protein
VRDPVHCRAGTWCMCVCARHRVCVRCAYAPSLAPASSRCARAHVERAYEPLPSASSETRPAKTDKHHGTVSSKIVEPASPPTPTLSCF